MALSKPFPGRQYGCTDQGGPEDCTEEQLSRLADAMYALQEAGLDTKVFWDQVPNSMKMEWNWSNWQYVAA